MGRGPKFSFPIPGRKSHTKVDRDRDNDDARSNRSNLSIPSTTQWSHRPEDPSSFSKAERLLGTAGLPIRPSSRNQNSMPQSPGFMSITVSEASYGSRYTDDALSMAGEDFLGPKRPGMSKRPSSNILGSVYDDESRRGSHSSSISHRLQPQTSNSTMRSYYDPQKSPLSISQQTSDSAVRDGALRKGKAKITPYPDEHHTLRPSSRQTMEDEKKEMRKNKPARLDLSKLFPKPRSNGADYSTGSLLSPNKVCNSPSAMSTASDYFPRPMTREPTPILNSRGHAKLTKTVKRQQGSSVHPAHRSTSPVRLHKRDTYDNAKVNVRRPPRGIQHWFDGLGEESDEDDGEEQHIPVVVVPQPVKPMGQHQGPIKKSSLGRLIQGNTLSPRQAQVTYAPQAAAVSKMEHYAHFNSSLAHRLNSPSQFSVQSQSSLVSSKTKSSAFSKNNLQDSSVLSISSSEDEDEDVHAKRSKIKVRDSIDLDNDQGEILIGKAQAFELRPQIPARRQSDSKMSTLSTSTNAATIEVMYTPDPYFAHQFPRQRESRRSSHTRQPSMIPEDENVRPKTSAHPPMSPTMSTTSLRSTRTSTSEPRVRAEGHKLMAVTAEEEALLEMMRKKRAAMAKHSFHEGYKTAILQEARQKTPENDNDYRTSAFLTNESPALSPARALNGASPRKSVTGPASPLLFPPPRGRPTRSHRDSTPGTSMLRDSSSCDPAAEREVSPFSRKSLAHQLPPHSEFSPLDIFPAGARTPTEASIASPTTTDHPSPLPSPVTPGLRNGEADVDVKVASSEPSYNGDSDEAAVLETGVIDPPSGSIKPGEESRDTRPVHQRSRTASSGADVSVSHVGKSFATKIAPTESHMDLAPVSETSSRASSIRMPKIPQKSTKRLSTLTMNTSATSRSKSSSVYSRRTSSPVDPNRRTSRTASRGDSISSIKRDSTAVGSASTRCSVSEDVLAAWGSLGGWRDLDGARIGGM